MILETDRLILRPWCEDDAEDPYNVRCVSFSPNGDVLDGNVYECDIMEIIKDYEP